MVGKSLGSLELPFGAALRRLRLAAGMSQESLALEAGVQRNFISLIETGQNQPTIGTICKLARALGMKASELVAAAESEPTSTARRSRKQT
jgi:transcriptional regulator with XRE-family HTH domain